MTEGLVKRCKDCKNFDVQGECRRSPPTRLPRQFSPEATPGNRVRDESLIWGWPKVNPNSWCGKFKKKGKVA